MNSRIEQRTFFKLQPALPQALIALGEAALASGLEPGLIHLIKLRASQINHCAYCQRMHAQEARKDGERQHRLDVLPAWREVDCFSERERAALNWCEKVTLLSQGAPTDEDFACLGKEFSEAEMVNLTAVVIAINGWNRIAACFCFAPDMND